MGRADVAVIDFGRRCGRQAQCGALDVCCQSDRGRGHAVVARCAAAQGRGDGDGDGVGGVLVGEYAHLAERHAGRIAGHQPAQGTPTESRRCGAVVGFVVCRDARDRQCGPGDRAAGCRGAGDVVVATHVRVLAVLDGVVSLDVHRGGGGDVFGVVLLDGHDRIAGHFASGADRLGRADVAVIDFGRRRGRQGQVGFVDGQRGWSYDEIRCQS